MSYEYQKLRSGLAIYKQKRSKNWYIRMRVSEGGTSSEFVRSLKTSSKDDATQKAWSYFFAKEDNLSPAMFIKSKKSNITHLATQLIEILKNKPKKINKDYIRVLDKEIIPTFGRLNIRDLDRAAIRQYFSDSAKSMTQLRIRKTALKHLFDIAVDDKLIKEYEIPSMPSVEVTEDEARSSFSDKDLGKLRGMCAPFIDSSRKDITKQSRKMFEQYMSFLLNTGIRAGEEALNIKFKDIGFDTTQNIYTITINSGKVHSKKKTSSRTIPISIRTMGIIEKVLCIFYGFTYKNHLDEVLLSSFPYKENYIFRLPTNQTIKPQYEKTFAQLCKFAEIDKEQLGYTLYSLRHTYITNQLKGGTDVYLLATHCGTSVEMIQRYYSKLTSVMRSSEIAGVFKGHDNYDHLPF
ncbi:TPA: site-specific integrase [Vibrio parahaemolyticus]|nr:site-specific integrase [Vibrio parahaemolyticus]